jgi:RNA methyltransferase
MVSWLQRNPKAYPTDLVVSNFVSNGFFRPAAFEFRIHLGNVEAMEHRVGDGEGAGGSKRKRGGGPAGAADADAVSSSSRGAGVAAVVDEDELLHPNFEELARQYPAFDAVYRRHPHLLPPDQAPPTNKTREGKGKKSGGSKLPGGGSKLQQAMASPEFRLELTRALLRHHWNVRLPAFDAATHLCPPVPNRYYLARWLRQDVLRATESGTSSTLFQPRAIVAEKGRVLRGLDIGTGAAAIYALLLAATAGSPDSASTEVFATDVDRAAVQQAQQNVEANRSLLWDQWRSTVRVLAVPQCDRQRDPSQPLLPTKDSAMEVEEPSNEQQQSNSASVPKGPLRVSMEAVAEFLRTSRESDMDEQGGLGLGVAGVSTQPQLDFGLTNPPFFDVDEDRGDRADGLDRATMTHGEGQLALCP